MGIYIFMTKEDGIGGRLRREIADFKVEEISDLPPEQPDGKFTAAIVTSTNWETNRLVRTFARRLRISRNKIMFAGTKDKRAITSQLFVFDAPLEDVRDIKLTDVEVRDAYSTGKRLDIGNLFGNKFEIRITELDVGLPEAMGIADSVSGQILENGGFANYFGVQRFGAMRPITHLIGRCIIEGEFKKGVDLYLGADSEYESEEFREARRSLRESGDYESALQEYPDVLGFEKAILNHLVAEPDDFVGALENLPKNLLMMFIHAYQSYIFNRILSRRVEAGLPLTPVEGDVILKLDKHGLPDHNSWVSVESHNVDKIGKQVGAGKAFVSAPLIGWESTFADGEPGEIEKRVFEEEKIDLQDFIIPEFDRLSSRGTRREIVAPLKELDVSEDGDGLLLKFRLNKGCYATSLLREFMKSNSLLDY